MIEFILEECIMVCGWCVLGRISEKKKKELKRKILYEAWKKEVKPSQKTGTCEKWSERKKWSILE